MAQDFDVIVVGAGGAGCLAAWRLASAGLRVALLERGGAAPSLVATASSPPGDGSARLIADPSDSEWPYEAAGENPQDAYKWLRAAGVGGRLNYWLGTSLRLQPEDFADSRAPGLQWPLTYDDMEPHYRAVEAETGCGAGHGFAGDAVDDWIATAVAACGAQVEPVRQAVGPPGPGPGGRFRPFSPLDRWVPEAVATGRCQVMASTVARRVLTSAGRVAGVEAVAAHSGSPMTLTAPAVILAGSTIETARLLLESASPEHPDGVGNHSGMVGRRLMDHVVVWARAFVAVPADQWDADRPLQSSYVPAWPDDHVNRPPPSRFHVQVVVRDVTATAPFRGGPGDRVVVLGFAGTGEALAIPGNEVVLDPGARRDGFGNTVPRVQFRWDEAHLALGRRIHDTLRAVVSALPCHVLGLAPEDVVAAGRPNLGGYGHEVGTARMGSDPTTSVVSPVCEVHGVENLFVVDGSVFVSYPDKNPTLTILANCARVCETMLGRS